MGSNIHGVVHQMPWSRGNASRVLVLLPLRGEKRQSDKSFEMAKSQVEIQTQPTLETDDFLVKDTVFQWGDPKYNTRYRTYAGETSLQKQNWNKIPNIPYAEEVEKMLQRDYEILGRGKSGEVYAGIYGNCRKNVAIKVFSKDTLASETMIGNARNSFLKEVEVLKELKHDNIVQLYAYSIHENEPKCALVYEKMQYDLYKALFEENRIGF